MSDRPAKSHAMPWTLSMLAVPVLYLLSVPPAICLAFKQRIVDAGAEDCPRLLELYITPYSRMRECTYFRKPMDGYLMLWGKIAGIYQDPPMGERSPEPHATQSMERGP
jgi:hypothetical protein